MRGKRIPYNTVVVSIAVGIRSGAGAAVPATIAGLDIARACLSGPISSESIIDVSSWLAVETPFAVTLFRPHSTRSGNV